MKYKDIFYLKEEQYYSINQQHFKNFMESFKKEFSIDITELAKSEGIPENDFVKQFYLLKYAINLYYPKYIPEFFTRLKASGFNMHSEIVDAMKILGENTIDILDENMTQYVLLSPYIQGLSINQGKITIYSDELGDYSFSSTRKHLLNNKEALRLIRKYVTQTYCYQISWELIQYLDNASLVTYLLPNYYEGNYYHSVIRDQDGLIVDVSNQVVYDEETRDSLFKGEIIVETKKENLNRQLQEAKEAEDNESKKIDFPNAVLLALHQESQTLKKN